jgi:uncharacterized protein (TIGR03435 family)
MNRFLLVVLCSVTASLAGQQAAATRFEIASIKLNTSGGNENSTVEPSGRVLITNMSLDNLVRGVFDIPRQDLVLSDRLPAWFRSDRWDITALGPPPRDDASERQIRTMMQNLLIDRFKLVTRREMRDVPVYALVVTRSDGRLGPQMKPSTADCAALLAAFKATGATRQTPDSNVCGAKSGKGRIWGTGVLMDDLARRLAVAGRSVVDMTGLAGPFDLDVRFAPDAADPAAAASVFTAVQEQLGLRLEPRQTAASVFVIESVERPTPD